MPGFTQARTRRRTTPLPKGGVVKLGYFNSALTDSNGVPIGWSPVPWGQTQHTYLSPFHTIETCVDDLHEGPPYHSGGPLRILKAYLSRPYGGVHGRGTYLRSDKLVRYVGGFRAAENDCFGTAPLWNTTTIFNNPSSYYPAMTGWGDKAYNRTKPRIQAAGGFVFAAELRDAPRMLQSTSRLFNSIWRDMGGNTAGRVMSPKAVADDFLNYQFGWKPFLKDLTSFDYVIQNYHKLSASRKDRNDKWMRKRVPLKTSIVEDRKVDSGLGYKLDPFLPLDYFATPPSWTLREEISNHVYGVGSFKYYLPEFDASKLDFDSNWNRAMRVLDITGFRISPANVYKSIPWTWAADWISNVGDHIEHYNDILVDSVACKYCYVMQSQVKTRKFTCVLPFHSGTISLSFSQVIETKQRDEASSPYGFSLSWADLSPTQIAIAGALGISKW